MAIHHLKISHSKPIFTSYILMPRVIVMLILSEVLIQNHQLESYSDLIDLIQKKAVEGEMFFDIDIKPPFPDTPDEWETDLEAKFTSPLE